MNVIEVIGNWLDACGMNSPADIREFFAESSDEQLVSEMESTWYYSDNNPHTHQKYLDAIADIRANIDDYYPLGE